MISILQWKTIQPRLRSEISLFFLGRSPVVRFYHKRAPSINVRRPQQPSAAEPLSNLRTLGAIAPSNFRILKPQRAPRRLYGFRRQRRYKKWRRRRRTSPAQRYYIPPEGGALNPPVRRSRSQAEPWQPRAERPGGWLNPHARKGVSTFGNTGKHDPVPIPTAPQAPEPSSPKGACPVTHQKKSTPFGMDSFYFFAFFRASLSLSFSAFLSLFSSARSSNSSTISSGSFTLYQKE